MGVEKLSSWESFGSSDSGMSFFCDGPFCISLRPTRLRKLNGDWGGSQSMLFSGSSKLSVTQVCNSSAWAVARASTADLASSLSKSV